MKNKQLLLGLVVCLLLILSTSIVIAAGKSGGGSASKGILSCRNSVTCVEIDRVWEFLTGLVSRESSVNLGQGEVYDPTTKEGGRWDEFCDVHDTECQGAALSGSSYSLSRDFSSHLVGPSVFCQGDTRMVSDTSLKNIQNIAWVRAPLADSETYEQIILELSEKNEIDPALLAAIAQKESGLGTDNSCTVSSHQVSALTGCGWPTGQCEDSASKSEAQSDRAQLECSSRTLLSANTDSFGTTDGKYKGCSSFSSSTEDRWKCILCVYNKGEPRTDCEYAQVFDDYYCPWFNYFQEKGVYMSGEGCSGLTTFSTNNYLIAGAEHSCMVSPAVTALEQAAVEFKARTGIRLYATSGFRSVEDQAELYWQNCYSQGKWKGCKPATSSLGIYNDKEAYSLLKSATSKAEVIFEFMKNGDPEDGFHTTGKAIDLWHEGQKGNFEAIVHYTQEVQNAMEKYGFCRLSSEGWHFDYGKSSCSTSGDYSYVVNGKRYDPVEICVKNECSDLTKCVWNYKENSFVSCSG